MRLLVRHQGGFTLIELVLIIVVIGLTIPAWTKLISMARTESYKSVVVSQAVLLAQEKMEEIIADRKSDTRGYNWVVTSGNYPDDAPATGFTRSVSVDTTAKNQNGISYALVMVTVSHSEIPNVQLTTWLTSY